MTLKRLFERRSFIAWLKKPKNASRTFTTSECNSLAMWGGCIVATYVAENSGGRFNGYSPAENAMQMYVRNADTGFIVKERRDGAYWMPKVANWFDRNGEDRTVSDMLPTLIELCMSA